MTTPGAARIAIVGGGPAGLMAAEVAAASGLQVDLYDATARGPVLDSAEFYSACAACLAPHGVMTVNLFGDHPSYAKNVKAMKFAFAHVLCLPEVHDGNVVALAFKQKPEQDADTLAARAAHIVASTKLPAKSWLKGIAAALATPTLSRAK